MADTDLLAAAYAPLLDLADRLAADGDDDTGWRATALPGWTVRDLLFHLAGDAQRALVALHTPASDPVDTDAASYWSRWTPGTAGAAAGLRATRTSASQWSSVRGPASLYAGTARAVLHAAAAADPEQPVGTQGHVLAVGDLLSTLVVEAAVHTLDLGEVVPAGPAPAALSEVRRVAEALLGAPVTAAVDDARLARLVTGRAAATPAERDGLGDAAGRLPLFG